MLNSPYMKREELKTALYSILIGACVSFITVLLQGLLGLLQGAEPAVFGSAAGILKFLITSKVRHFV